MRDASPPDVVSGRVVLPTSQRTLVFGVLNVTPDSFSDGGRYLDPLRAIEHGRALAAEGADVIDVGGESTRPGAQPVALDEELRRVIPVVGALAADGLLVSIDTRKAKVAGEAVAAGAVIVNDVSGGAADEAMFATVADLDVAYVLMHTIGTPQTMQQEARYDDVVAEVVEQLARGLDAAEAAGIARARILVDPGIGFAKTLEHNLLLLRHLDRVVALGRPVLVGTSRKSFIGKLTGGATEDDRLEGSLVTAILAVMAGAAAVRVHDVAATVRALAVARALRDGDAPEGPTES